MVCLACLLPLFLVPIVNLLPLLFDFIMVSEGPSPVDQDPHRQILAGGDDGKRE